MKRLFIVMICSVLAVGSLYAQQCTDSWPGGNQNMSTLTGWSCTGGGAAFYTSGTYTESLTIGTSGAQIGTSDTFTMDFNFTLNGSISFNAQGSSPTVTIPAGVTVTINGNWTDLNNNVTFNVLGKLIVTGNFTAKNNTAFSGGPSGTISIGGTLSLGTNATCSGTCPAITAGSCTGSSPTFCSNNVLPVTLIFFKGTSSANQVLLNWATASELNFDHFNLEKSANGQDFYTIANIKGHGTTNIRQDYQAVDANPVIGYNYYRLTSVDFDNYQETFDMIAVKYTGGKKLALSPNPFNGSDLNFNSNFDFSGAGTLNIFDSMGILVSSFNVPESNTTLHFSTPLKTGVYIAKFSSASFSDVARLVVK